MENLPIRISPTSGISTPIAFEDDSFLTSDTEQSQAEDSIVVSTDGQGLKHDHSERGLSSEEPNPKESISRLLKDKEKEWSDVAGKKGPLNLLDLPVDILKEIVHQVSMSRTLCSQSNCSPRYSYRIRTISPRLPSATQHFIVSRFHTSTPGSILFGPMPVYTQSLGVASML